MSNSGCLSINSSINSSINLAKIKLRLLLMCLLLLSSLQPLAASENAPAFIKAELGEETQLVGTGTLRWFGIRVYDAKLWAPQGRYQADQAHALQLIYGHDFTAADLVKEGGKQLRKQGITEDRIQRWQGLMQQAFIDVKAGDSLTALVRADHSLAFYSTNATTTTTTLTTTINDTEFSQHFLDIWLGSKTTEPKLRLKLIGQDSAK